VVTGPCPHGPWVDPAQPRKRRRGSGCMALLREPRARRWPTRAWRRPNPGRTARSPGSATVGPRPSIAEATPTKFLTVHGSIQSTPANATAARGAWPCCAKPARADGQPAHGAAQTRGAPHAPRGVQLLDPGTPSPRLLRHNSPRSMGRSRPAPQTPPRLGVHGLVARTPRAPMANPRLAPPSPGPHRTLPRGVQLLDPGQASPRPLRHNSSRSMGRSCPTPQTPPRLGVHGLVARTPRAPMANPRLAPPSPGPRHTRSRAVRLWRHPRDPARIPPGAGVSRSKG
jgi:hypothetical protein